MSGRFSFFLINKSIYQFSEQPQSNERNKYEERIWKRFMLYVYTIDEDNNINQLVTKGNVNRFALVIFNFAIKSCNSNSNNNNRIIGKPSLPQH